MAALNFHHLRLFRAVAHEGNLTRAARRLNLSQSALSVQIRRLEESLDHTLFERRGRQLVLTEAGRIALDHADAIFATGEQLLHTLRDGTNQRRIVRIGALATLSRNFQISFLEPILGDADVEVILRSGNLPELLRDLETLDLDMVLSNRSPDPGSAAPIIAHRLADLPVSLIARSADARDADAASLLATQPLILPSAASGIRAGLDAWLASRGLSPQIAAEVDDMAMMRLMARQGVGLAVLPPIVVRDELESGLLSIVLDLPSITEAIHALTMKRQFGNPLVERLLGAPLAATAPDQGSRKARAS